MSQFLRLMQPASLAFMSLLWVSSLQLSAQSQTPTQTLPSPIIFNDPTPPDQGAAGGRQRGGASRGNCRQFEALTAMVPAKQGKAWGQTVSDRPTFWFYLPAALTKQTPIEFVLQDAADNYLYNVRMAVPQPQSGLVQMALPATTKPLEVGKAYTWTFSVYCDPAKPSSAVFVQGMVRRVALEAAAQRELQTVTPLKQVSLYAANGIWYEAFNVLATLYRATPQERQIATAWTSLLQQAKLESLTTAPFTTCCTVQSRQ